MRDEFKRNALKDGVAWYEVDGAREMSIVHNEICDAVRGIQISVKENFGIVKPLWISVPR